MRKRWLSHILHEYFNYYQFVARKLTVRYGHLFVIPEGLITYYKDEVYIEKGELYVEGELVVI